MNPASCQARLSESQPWVWGIVRMLSWGRQEVMLPYTNPEMPPAPRMSKRQRKFLAAKELGERIRAAREKYSISRLVLAYTLGCSPSLVQKWENGLCWPKIPDLLLMARCLEKPLEYFLYGLDGPPFETVALEIGVITEQDLLTVRSRMNAAWSRETDYPDVERDGITEETRDKRRRMFGDIQER